MNAAMMTTNLKAELPGYGTVWFDPQAMTIVLSFDNIAKQYPIQYLQESDTFQLHYTTVSIFLAVSRLTTYMLWKEINPEKDLNKPPHPNKRFPKYQ